MITRQKPACYFCLCCSTSAPLGDFWCPVYLKEFHQHSRDYKLVNLSGVKWVKSLSRVQLFATPWTEEPTRLLCPWDFPGNSTGVDCHFLLQRIFPTQESNPGLPHCRQTLYRLSHQTLILFKDHIKKSLSTSLDSLIFQKEDLIDNT